jgi:hypothetical protein
MPVFADVVLKELKPELHADPDGSGAAGRGASDGVSS